MLFLLFDDTAFACRVRGLSSHEDEPSAAFAWLVRRLARSVYELPGLGDDVQRLASLWERSWL